VRAFPGLLAGALLVASAGFAQTAPDDADAPSASGVSAIRKLLEAPGKVVIERVRGLDPVQLDSGTVSVSAIGAFEPGAEEQRVLGLRIDLRTGAVSGADGQHYLDVHEIEAFLKGIFLLEQVAAESPAGYESEADYLTVEGFRVGVTVRSSPRFWIEGGHEERTRTGISRDNVAKLRQRLELARTRLFTE